jgi:hypothetical protein
MQDREMKIRRESWTMRNEEICGFCTVNQIMLSDYVDNGMGVTCSVSMGGV